jgi:hypothetical protein
MGLGGLIAGVGFNVTIRGILVVLVGAGVLMGSTWILLATNLGTRLGALVAFSSFFGWMVIMSIIWTMFGIGWKGNPPSWHLLDVNYNQLAGSPVKPAQGLVDPTKLPNAYDLVVNSNDDAAKKEFASPIPADRLQGLSPAEQDAARKDWDAKNRATTLSQLAAVAPELTKNIDVGKGWRLLSTAQEGEGAAAASAAIVAHGEFKKAEDFLVLDAFDYGGKPKLKQNPNRWDRISHKIDTIIHFRHPAHYEVVQIQQVIPQETQPGQAPPRSIVDTKQPIISIVMERNLGALRIHDVLILIGSVLLFAVSVTMLHYRDKESMARRAALVGKQ